MLTISEKEFRQLSELIKEKYGINLKEEKKTFMIGRLHNLLTQMGFSTFSQYYNYLLIDKTGKAESVLLDKITTNHTFFMREADHFFYFRDEVLPRLKGVINIGDLRGWCAASSSGEEPYTIAMIINDFIKSNKLDWDKKLLATDISLNVLETARAGIYSNEKVDTLPKYWQLSYFQKYDSNNKILKDEIKNEVLFRRLNLMDEVFPFRKKLHFVFCRNVMIYFDIPTKEKLIKKIHGALETGGYLFIGHSESLGKDNPDFKYLCPSVYKKI